MNVQKKRTKGPIWPELLIGLRTEKLEKKFQDSTKHFLLFYVFHTLICNLEEVGGKYFLESGDF